MTDEPLSEGTVLGTMRKPASGWGPSAALELNSLVRRLAAAHDWRHLVIQMHPATWRQVFPYLDYNLSFPKPGIPMDMDGGLFPDRNRIDVIYREVVRHPY
jgi:hypothetical protein